MRLLNDDFLVVENQFGTLNTMALRIGHSVDPEYTPRGKIHPLFLMSGILAVFGIPFLLMAASMIREGAE